MTVVQATAPAPAAAGAAPGRRPRKAHASLHFIADGRGRTVIGRQYMPYPFHITRPFRVDRKPAQMARVYLQSSSGGLYRDDQLDLTINAGRGTAAHVTTQASTIIHDSRGGGSVTNMDIHAADGAFVEVLPDPVILFAGADLTARVVAHVADNATLLLCDSFLSHDYQGGTQPFARYRNEIIIRDSAGKPIAIDRADIEGKELSAAGPAVHHRFACHGMIFVLAPNIERLHTALLGTCRADEDNLSGASVIAGGRGVMARVLARDGHHLTAALETFWQAARLALTGETPPPRRK